MARGESNGLPPMWTGHGSICGLSLLLVLVFAQRGFSLGTPVFPSPEKSAFINSNLMATGLTVVTDC